MKLPFEKLSGFVAWYISPQFPLVLPSQDLAAIINESSGLEPMESAKIKMAVFEGVGNSSEIHRLARVISRDIERKIEPNGWPYSYVFEGREALSARLCLPNDYPACCRSKH